MELASQLVPASVIADRYGVTVETVVRWARERRVPCFRPSRRVLRFRVDNVDAALTQVDGLDSVRRRGEEGDA